MRHLKFLNSLLFLVANYQSFSLVLDNFKFERSSGDQLGADVSEYADLSNITITYEDGITYNNYTRTMEYNSNILRMLSYEFTPPIDITKTPLIRLNFPSMTLNSTINPFTAFVELRDRKGNEIDSKHEIFGASGNDLTKPLLNFDFTEFVKDPKVTFDFSDIEKITFNLNSEAVGERHINAIFDLQNVELLESEPVPEPISMLTLGAGIATLIQKKRKKK